MVPLRTSFGKVTLRDQIPLNTTKLAKALGGLMTIEEWVALLDCRVFFWAQRESVDKLIYAKPYRNYAQTIIKVDARRFVDKYHSKIEVADINAGSTYYKAVPRGRHTFQSIEAYTRIRRREIVEVTVLDAALDLDELNPCVVRREPNGTETQLS
jgi:uncharacterized protein DUF7002